MDFSFYADQIERAWPISLRARPRAGDVAHRDIDPKVSRYDTYSSQAKGKCMDPLAGFHPSYGEAGDFPLSIRVAF
jgi:hypothetical protein